MAVGIEMDVFHQDLADALHDTADDLAFQQQRVHHRADVVHHAVTHDLDRAGLGIDLHFAGMATVRVIGGLGAEDRIGDQSRVQLHRNVFRIDRLACQLLHRDGLVAFGRGENALIELDIGGVHIPQVRRDLLCLLDDTVGCLIEGGTADGRGA